MKNKSCYDYEEYIFNNPLLDVDATYIIHLIGNGRYENIIEQLYKFPISKKVYILLNKGYKKCNKGPDITKPPLDLIDAYLEIFDHAKDKKSILILEDDFIFDNKILEPIHKLNINHFIKEKTDTEFVYYIGAVPFVLLPYDFYNYKNILALGSHSVIYSKKFRENTLDKILKINDWDLYLNTTWSRYIYYTPLCYQLLPETENSKYWASHNFILYYISLFIKIITKIIRLDKSTAAYSYFYFFSKLWIVLILYILYMIAITISRMQ
jgi:hypothetical protein